MWFFTMGWFGEIPTYVGKSEKQIDNLPRYIVYSIRVENSQHTSNRYTIQNWDRHRSAAWQLSRDFLGFPFSNVPHLPRNLRKWLLFLFFLITVQLPIGRFYVLHLGGRGTPGHTSALKIILSSGPIGSLVDLREQKKKNWRNIVNKLIINANRGKEKRKI